MEVTTMKKSLKFFTVIIFILAFGNVTKAAILHVPGDFEAIQDAIDNALTDDTVLVDPGTYFENINFKGKSILVISRDGPETTIIDGGNIDSVVTFNSGEGLSSILGGFTITNGRALSGGGIYIGNSSPTITGNKIIGNEGADGVGIAVLYASPLIELNIVSDNIRTFGSGGMGGGGILLAWSSGTQVLDNVISNNITSADGGGICMFMAGDVVIRGNTISGNSSGCGGGISMANWSDALIVQNLIVGNSAGQGNGICWLVPHDSRGPLLVNNTIVGSNNPSGSVIFAEGFDTNTKLVNNIIVATPGQTAILCGDMFDSIPPIIEYNDTFSPSGNAYEGVCSDQTGTNGNISADPLFFDLSNQDYHIQVGSPVIDVGNNAAPEIPSTDFDGYARVVDGDSNGLAVVDMGVYEFMPQYIKVVIDIKPGSYPNNINLNSKGKVPIALLTTDDFDADDVEPVSCKFAEASPLSWTMYDVDNDGADDVVMHFKTQELDLNKDSTEATLKCETYDGIIIIGTDSVNIVPKCKTYNKKNKKHGKK